MEETQLIKSREPIPKRIEDVASVVVDTAFTVHKELGPGLLESAYESCLIDELKSRGHTVKTQISLPVRFRGREIKDAYRIDVIVDDCLVVEIKSIDSLQLVHKQQVLTYLRFSGHRLGLLINFNTGLIKDGIKRVIL